MHKRCSRKAFNKVLTTLILISSFTVETSAQDSVPGKVDSTIAYVRYNPKVNKYAVWARDHDPLGWWDFLSYSKEKGYFFRRGSTRMPFMLFDTKEEADSVARTYVPLFRTALRNRMLTDYEKLSETFQ